jgi:hypothetical protein
MSDRVPPVFSFCGSRLDLCAVACSTPSRRCHLLSCWRAVGGPYCCAALVPRVGRCSCFVSALALAHVWPPLHPWLRVVRAFTYLRVRLVQAETARVRTEAEAAQKRAEVNAWRIAGSPCCLLASYL